MALIAKPSASSSIARVHPAPAYKARIASTSRMEQMALYAQSLTNDCGQGNGHLDWPTSIRCMSRAGDEAISRRT